eukprot:scaffold79364_cov36-Phaeocystis_antarctica.AAC.1
MGQVEVDLERAEEVERHRGNGTAREHPAEAVPLCPVQLKSHAAVQPLALLRARARARTRARACTRARARARARVAREGVGQLSRLAQVHERTIVASREDVYHALGVGQRGGRAAQVAAERGPLGPRRLRMISALLCITGGRGGGVG